MPAKSLRAIAKSPLKWTRGDDLSYEDMVAMLSQFAEEAAADRQAIREMVAAMFQHQSNGGGQS